MRRLVVTEEMIMAACGVLDRYRDELLVSNREVAVAIFKALPAPKKHRPARRSKGRGS